jgi:hypothetical protein
MTSLFSDDKPPGSWGEVGVGLFGRCLKSFGKDLSQRRGSILHSCLMSLAVLLLWPLVVVADAGLPLFSAPDWSRLSTPQWAGVGLALSLTLGWLGVWAFKHPFAAQGCFLWLLALPSSLIGAFAVAFAVGFRSFLPLPFAAGGLGLAAWAAIAGYKVMKANGEWSRRALVPGLIGLSVLALILGLTFSALNWTDPDSSRPPGGDRPPVQPAGAGAL